MDQQPHIAAGGKSKTHSESRRSNAQRKPPHTAASTSIGHHGSQCISGAVTGRKQAPIAPPRRKQTTLNLGAGRSGVKLNSTQSTSHHTTARVADTSSPARKQPTSNATSSNTPSTRSQEQHSACSNSSTSTNNSNSSTSSSPPHEGPTIVDAYAAINDCKPSPRRRSTVKTALGLQRRVCTSSGGGRGQTVAGGKGARTSRQRLQDARHTPSNESDAYWMDRLDVEALEEDYRRLADEEHEQEHEEEEDDDQEASRRRRKRRGNTMRNRSSQQQQQATTTTTTMVETFRMSDHEGDDHQHPPPPIRSANTPRHRKHADEDSDVDDVDAVEASPTTQLSEVEYEIIAGLKLNAQRRRKLQHNRKQIIDACLDNPLPEITS